MHDISAFILAGGKSRRMGQDKAFLQLAGQTLLARALDLARTICNDVRIVGNAEKFAAFASVTEDIFPDRGPLGGIHAALKNSSTELNLLLAVDMPFMEPAFLEHLITEARETDALVTVPRSAGGWQPLCAIYRRGFATVAEDSLRAGHNKIDPLFAQVQTRVIEEAELTQIGFTPEIFRNLNTPEDLAQTQPKSS